MQKLWFKYQGLGFSLCPISHLAFGPHFVILLLCVCTDLIGRDGNARDRVLARDDRGAKRAHLKKSQQ